jgi:hypothetical protein
MTVTQSPDIVLHSLSQQRFPTVIGFFMAEKQFQSTTSSSHLAYIHKINLPSTTLIFVA